jgi:hypothetical protein
VKRRYIIAMSGLAVAVTAALCLVPREPVYHGRRCRVWLAGFDNSATRGEASNAIRELGASTLPYLITELRAKDSVWKIKLVQLAATRLGLNFRFTPDQVRRTRAVEACALLGPLARPAIPALGVALNNGAGNAVPVLERFGPESIPPLTSALTNAPGCGPPYATAQALGRMGAKARISVTNLIWNFERHPIGPPRAASAMALAKISRELIEKEHQPACPEVILAKAALIRGLSDTNRYRVIAAAGALSLLQVEAKEGVPALMKLLKDPEPSVQESAIKALEAIEPGAAAMARAR